ncbi:MAG: hypothetical protein ABI892_12160 [Flavobacterium sp.]
MNRILENIKQLAKNEEVTITKLEQIIGASKGVLSRAIANKTDIQSKWILKVVENYPLYSCEWLIKSKGEMIISTKVVEPNEVIQETAINYKDLAEARKETIDAMKKQIMYLEEKIEDYKIQLHED